MKLSLEVLTPGKGEGKVIPITLAQFVIGRDPQCQLRPASAVISKRHCALLIRGEKAFVRDFESTNGTFVNDEPVKGERELSHGDRLKAGPLLFGVRLETSLAVSKPTPAPASKPSAGALDDESAAAMLLALQDDDTAGDEGREKDSAGVPTGSTVMEIMSPVAGGPDDGVPGAAAQKKEPPKPAPTTSSAAKAILEKYMRRPRI